MRGDRPKTVFEILYPLIIRLCTDSSKTKARNMPGLMEGRSSRKEIFNTSGHWRVVKGMNGNMNWRCLVYPSQPQPALTMEERGLTDTIIPDRKLVSLLRQPIADK